MPCLQWVPLELCLQAISATTIPPLGAEAASLGRSRKPAGPLPVAPLIKLNSSRHEAQPPWQPTEPSQASEQSKATHIRMPVPAALLPVLSAHQASARLACARRASARRASARRASALPACARPACAQLASAQLASAQLGSAQLASVRPASALPPVSVQATTAQLALASLPAPGHHPKSDKRILEVYLLQFTC